MPGIADGFKDIFLAGVGAMAIGAEKSKELVDQLIAKGEITVEQGKQLNTELKHRVEDAAGDLRDDALAARLAFMTPEERESFAARVNAMVAAANAEEQPGSASGVETFTSPDDVTDGAAAIAAEDEASDDAAPEATARDARA